MSAHCTNTSQTRNSKQNQRSRFGYGVGYINIVSILEQGEIRTASAGAERSRIAVQPIHRYQRQIGEITETTGHIIQQPAIRPHFTGGPEVIIPVHITPCIKDQTQRCCISEIQVASHQNCVKNGTGFGWFTLVLLTNSHSTDAPVV